MKIGMIQMDAAAGHMEHNIAHGFELMEEAAEHSDLVVMPELWTIGYNFHDLDKKAIQEKDSLLQKLRNLARTFGVTLIPGTLPVMKRGKIYNTAYVIGPDGEIQGSYSKRHLFHEYLESKLMEPGRGMLCTHIQGVKCGLAICFELYFPSGRKIIWRTGMFWPEPGPLKMACIYVRSIWQEDTIIHPQVGILCLWIRKGSAHLKGMGKNIFITGSMTMINMKILRVPEVLSSWKNRTGLSGKRQRLYCGNR